MMRSLLLNLALYLRHPRLIFRFLEKKHRFPNIAHPKTIEEKFLWRKIFDHNPRFAEVSDKLKAKEYAARKCPDILIPKVAWTGQNSDDIPKTLLNSGHILKANHGSGFNAFLPASEPASLNALTQTWLGRQFGRNMGEWGYSTIKRTLFIEETIGGGVRAPIEYKMHCCNGRVVWGYEIMPMPEQPDKATIFDRNGVIYAAQQPQAHPQDRIGQNISLPKDVINFTEALADGFDAVRVDIYEFKGDIHFGEMTVYAASGYAKFHNEVLRDLWAANWDLRRTWFLQTPQVGWKSAYATHLARNLAAPQSGTDRSAPT